MCIVTHITPPTQDYTPVQSINNTITTAHIDMSALAGQPGTKTERTFVAVKPDGVQRGLIGDIISRFESKGFKIVGLKLLVPTKEQAEAHYEEHKGMLNYLQMNLIYHTMYNLLTYMFCLIFIISFVQVKNSLMV